MRFVQLKENLNACPETLSFTTMPKSTNDPIHIRRATCVSRLEEQKLQLKDPNHIRGVQRWVKIDGEKQAVTRQRPSVPGGRSILQAGRHVQFGVHLIEFEKALACPLQGPRSQPCR